MEQIRFYPETKEFHLSNDRISYFIKIMRNGHPAHLYFGAKLPEKEDYGYFLQLKSTSHTSYLYEDDFELSLEHARLEYPCYGTTDYRIPAYEIKQENGSSITDFKYESYRIMPGKKAPAGLPGIVSERDDVAETLEITLRDELLNARMILSYTIFERYDAIIRNTKFVNDGGQTLRLTKAMSFSLDFFDADYTMLQLDGSWARERYIHTRKLAPGLQGIESMRGASSAEHNPFLALQRAGGTEHLGSTYGFSLIYSGNFEAVAQVDRFERARVMMGIHPFLFEWIQYPETEFQTPEAVMVYSEYGMNGMSQCFHDLYNERLVRGKWRGKTRPILLNNWEGTYFHFDEEILLRFAEKAKELGIELFVLDDGWFGHRDDGTSSLGDWFEDRRKLPDGIKGLAGKIHALGLQFGLWFEPEMVSRDSCLYREHPEWVVGTPGRAMSHGRNQYVLDFSRDEVVDYIFGQMERVIREGKIDYVKWDMNRDITEAYSAALGCERQGEFFHRYILGVYRLYEMLTGAFPDVLFESCASGGARFDPGMLCYAPQAWASDDTDAVERLKIQYGSSVAYPVSSISAHVSAVPNHQVLRSTSLKMRAQVAFFGDFGYELDPMKLTSEEEEEIRGQITFYKRHRELFQFGTFYRLLSPFSGTGDTAWMAVSKDRKIAAVAYYKVLARPNPKSIRLPLRGLIPGQKYRCSRSGEIYFGDELMKMGFLPDPEFTGSTVRNPNARYKNSGTDKGDFTSQVYLLEAVQ